MTKARDISDLFSTANTANGFVKLNGSAQLPSISATNLTSIPASSLTGTLPAIDGSALTGIQGITTGLIIPYSSATVPSGYLECDGTAISRTTYANLFTAIGVVWGAGNGSTTFNIPDLRDRTAVHKSVTKSFATTGGANTVTPTGTIAGATGETTLTTAQLPSHTHGMTFPSTYVYDHENYIMRIQGVHPYNVGTYLTKQSDGSGSGSSHDHTLSATFAGSSTSVLQPYATLIYIIKT